MTSRSTAPALQKCNRSHHITQGREQPLHALRSQLAVASVALMCAFANAQNTLATDASANVHLEPHDGQTHFKLGDPIIVDLVFTGPTKKYIVKADTSPYLPPADQIEIAPPDGWLRTRSTSRGLPVNLSAIASLNADAVRVPVLVNRTITFEHPGHYQIAITTDRLRLAETILKPPAPDQQQCLTCRTTNAIGIEIADRDPAEEATLVASLTQQIESAKETSPASVLTPSEQQEAQDQMDHELSEFMLGADRSDEDKTRDAFLIWKWNEAVRKQAAAIDTRRTTRRDAAIQLACLASDDAIRAKVHLIATTTTGGDPDSIDWIIVNGLTSSHNQQLQLDLLQQAWRAPQNVPNYQLHTALQQARELALTQTVTAEPQPWSTPEVRNAQSRELQADLGDLLATLPQRSEENRAQTIDFLKSLGVPTQLSALKASR